MEHAWRDVAILLSARAHHADTVLEVVDDQPRRSLKKNCYKSESTLPAFPITEKVFTIFKIDVIDRPISSNPELVTK